MIVMGCEPQDRPGIHNHEIDTIRVSQNTRSNLVNVSWYEGTSASNQTFSVLGFPDHLVTKMIVTDE